jgi:hypothetical protein
MAVAIALAGVITFVAGTGLTIWTANWKWVATGILAFALLTTVAAVVQGGEGR